MSNRDNALSLVGMMVKARIIQDPVPKASHAELILVRLLKTSITPAEAFEDFGCMRLSARIHDLRKKGIEIKTIREPTSRGGSYARYELDE